MSTGYVRGRWYDLWPVASLCLLVATRWLIEGVDVNASSSLWQQAFSCLLVAGGAAWLDRSAPGHSSDEDASVSARFGYLAAVAVGLLLSGAAVGDWVAGRPVAASAATLALALTPSVAAILSVVTDEVAGGDMTGRLWPGLAGLAGLLLLLPQPGSTAVRFWLGLACMPLLTAAGASLGSAQVRREMRGRPASSTAFMPGCVLAGVAFALLALLRDEQIGQSVHIAGLGLDALTVSLNLLALRRLQALRWSAQFLLIPLLSLAEGIVTLHPVLDARSWVGFGLLLAGGMRQLMPDPAGTAELVSLREPSA